MARRRKKSLGRRCYFRRYIKEIAMKEAGRRRREDGMRRNVFKCASCCRVDSQTAWHVRIAVRRQKIEKI